MRPQLVLDQDGNQAVSVAEFLSGAKAAMQAVQVRTRGGAVWGWGKAAWGRGGRCNRGLAPDGLSIARGSRVGQY
jgi:hypothetical protein